MNYFNYFTEIEEHFQRVRNSGTFMLSPLDWALVEVWKDSGVPIEAVYKGIDRTFEKWNKRKRRMRAINSVAYCSQEILSADQKMEDGIAVSSQTPSSPSFNHDELAEYFQTRSNAVQIAGRNASAEFGKICRETAVSLNQLASSLQGGLLPDLESIEQRLTALEERLLVAAMQKITEEEMIQVRCELDSQLVPYRSKMTTGQLALLERQFLQRQIFEVVGLPRLSLFYLN